MKVKKMMTAEAESCRAEESLTKAAEIMKRRDCGVVPIVDDENRVVGMITDRDIAIAVCSLNRKPSQIKIGEIAGGSIITCSTDEETEDALKKMRRKRVKRLPVISQNKEFAGILSITDILLKDKKSKKKAFSALKAISRPRPIVLHEVVGEKSEKQPTK